MPIAIVVMHRNWPLLAVAACAPFVLLPFPVIIVIGARMLARLRRYGMAMTAAIVCLAAGLVSLLTMFGVGGFSVFRAVMAAREGLGGDDDRFFLISFCSYSLMAMIVAFCSLFAGFVSLRTLMNAEVKRSFT
jgi:hypothetical protein